MAHPLVDLIGLLICDDHQLFLVTLFLVVFFLFMLGLRIRGRFGVGAVFGGEVFFEDSLYLIEIGNLFIDGAHFSDITAVLPSLPA